MRSKCELLQYLEEILHDGQTTTDDLRDAAVDLHNQLILYRPPIDSFNSIIGIRDPQGAIRSDREKLTDYYKENRGIEF